MKHLDRLLARYLRWRGFYVSSHRFWDAQREYAKRFWEEKEAAWKEHEPIVGNDWLRHPSECFPNTEDAADAKPHTPDNEF